MYHIDHINRKPTSIEFSTNVDDVCGRKVVVTTIIDIIDGPPTDETINPFIADHIWTATGRQDDDFADIASRVDRSNNRVMS